MAKKCAICGDRIDVMRGGYLNVYEDPWKMESYHILCYRAMVLENEEGVA